MVLRYLLLLFLVSTLFGCSEKEELNLTRSISNADIEGIWINTLISWDTIMIKDSIIFRWDELSNGYGHYYKYKIDTDSIILDYSGYYKVGVPSCTRKIILNTIKDSLIIEDFHTVYPGYEGDIFLRHENEVIPIPKNCDELKAQGIIDSFPYPIRPGSEAWSYIDNQTERYETVTVPAYILEEMCTHGLVYTCVYCPIFITQLTVFNCDRDGFLSLCSNINSFGELIKREDAGIELFDYYTLLTDTALNNITLFSYRFQIFSVEIFFSQQEFLSQFNSDLLNEVLLKAYDNLLIKEKLEIDRTFCAANLYLTTNILYYNIKYQPLIDFIDNNETLGILCKSSLWNKEVTDSLRYYTEEYVIENLK